MSEEFERLSAELSLGPVHEVWRDELASSAGWRDEGFTFPPRQEVLELCHSVELAGEPASILADLWEALDASWALRRLLHHCRWRLFGSGTHSFAFTWPMLPGSAGDTGRMFYVAVLLASLEKIRREHAALGIPEAVSRDTLADVGRQAKRFRAMHGVWGLDEIAWLGFVFTGRLFQLGRLQFMMSALWFPMDAATRESCPLRPWEPILDIHVPAIGPLSPAACDQSIDQAREFFARYFPDFRYRAMTILSWLLDPSLADYLAPESNIVRFQRRFTRVAMTQEIPPQIFKFVFQTANQNPSRAELDALPQRTSLERAVVTHLKKDGIWRAEAGYFSSP